MSWGHSEFQICPCLFALCFCTHPRKVGRVSTSCMFSFLCRRSVTHTSWSHYTSNTKLHELWHTKNTERTARLPQLCSLERPFQCVQKWNRTSKTATFWLISGLRSIFLPPFLHWQAQSFVLPLCLVLSAKRGVHTPPSGKALPWKTISPAFYGKKGLSAYFKMYNYTPSCKTE